MCVAARDYCDFVVVQDVLMDLKSARLSHVRPAGLSSDHETYVVLLYLYTSVKFIVWLQLLLEGWEHSLQEDAVDHCLRCSSFLIAILIALLQQPGFDLPCQTWRPRPMQCLFAQMGPCPIRPLWLWSSADSESHCRHVSIDEVWWWTHEADDDSQLAEQYDDNSIQELNAIAILRTIGGV